MTAPILTAPVDVERRILSTTPRRYLIGFDEAGYGAIAGPVTVGCAILPFQSIDLTPFGAKSYVDDIHGMFYGVKDSKLFNDTKNSTAHDKRKDVLGRTASRAVFVMHKHVSASVIDEIGISQAKHDAVVSCLRSAVSSINVPKSQVYLLCDAGLYNHSLGYAGEDIVKGDLNSLTIAMASIVAKVARDEYMLDLHKRYPEYGFNQHKGYYAHGTGHIRRLKEHGLINEYRRSISSIQRWISSGELKGRDV